MTAVPPQPTPPATPPARSSPPRQPSGLSRWWKNFSTSFRFDFPGPVFHREMLGSQRKLWAFLGRMFYVLIFAGILWFVYAQVRESASFGQSPVLKIQSLQTVAPALTVAVMVLQACLIAIMAPGTTSGAMSDEKRKRTLDVLLTSPIRPWQIVMGKLLAGVTTLSILAFCALPVLLAVRVFGGVEAKYIVGSFALSISIGAVMASLAMMNSFWFKKSSTSGFLAFIFFGILQAIPAILGVLITQLNFASGSPGPGRLGEVMFAMPSASAIGLMVYEITGLMPGGGPRSMWHVAIIYNLAITAAIVMLCTLMLRRLMLKLAAGDAPTTVFVGRSAVEAPAPKVVKEEAEDSIEAKPATKAKVLRHRKVSREVGDRPVLWRELSQPLFRRPILGIVSIVAIAGFSLFFYWMSMESFGGEIRGHVFTTNMVFAIIMLFQAASLTTSGFTSEREAKTWEVLLTSPLRSGDLVIGKFAGAMRQMWLLPAALVLNIGLLGVVAGHLTPVTLLLTIVIFVAPLTFLASAGTLFSVGAKSANAAGARVLGVALGLWAGLPLLGGIAYALADLYRVQGSYNSMIDRYMDIVFTLNPVYNFGQSLEAGLTSNLSSQFGSGGGPQGTVQYTLGRPEWSGTKVSTSTYVAVMAAVAALYFGGTALLLRRAMTIFAKKSGRTS